MVLFRNRTAGQAIIMFPVGTRLPANHKSSETVSQETRLAIETLIAQWQR